MQFLKVAKTIASAKTRAAVVSMAQDDAAMAASIDQWDADPMLLNTPTCVVDLRTGEMRAHDPNDYMTKTCAVGPDPKCPTPLFTAFLRKITGGDEELIRYFQRRYGYTLTGLTREHALFFDYGTGGNGKGVLMSTVAGILGDYHRVVPMDALMTTFGDRHPTELAGLMGARMATASETKSGGNWDESKIKALTGGEMVTARFMRQDFFDFTPQFKLFISGNNQPGLREVDEAIRRRLQIAPFNVTIPDEERDTELAEKLKEEWPGILWWMIEGCLEWQRVGLAPPSAVTDATETYLSAQDLLELWIDECCERAPKVSEQSSKLFENWKTWTEARGERPGHQRSFNERMEKHGFRRNQKDRKGRSFGGLQLQAKDEADADAPRHSLTEHIPLMQGRDQKGRDRPAL